MGFPSASVRKAEERAYDGKNESQDSQKVFDQFVSRFGMGLMSSSPPRGASVPAPVPLQIAELREKVNRKKASTSASCSDSALPASSTRHARRVGVDDHRPISPISSESRQQSTPERGDIRPVSPKGRDASEQPAASASHARLTELSGRPFKVYGPFLKRRRKMDPSPSPTQSNDGRSYEQYFDTSPRQKLLLSEDLPGHHEPTSPDDDRTLHEDDTGAVKFDLDALRGTDKTPGLSSYPDDSSVVDYDPLTTARTLAPQFCPPPPIPQCPETPAPPVNPFRQSLSQLLPPSQLFAATQVSSAVKITSPTSSRPSPNFFNQNSISPNPPAAISSPLKARGLRSSPAVHFTSSPQILPGTRSTDLENPPSSPVRSTSTKNPVIPDSQTKLPPKSSVPEPRSTYEPMHKSQERRSTSEVRGTRSSPIEDDDDDSLFRQRRAKAKKEAALRQLTSISIARPQKSDDVEVPFSSKRRPKPNKPDFQRWRMGSRSADDEVADSQEKVIPAVDIAERPDIVMDSQDKVPQAAQTPAIVDESTQSGDEEMPGGDDESMPDTAPGFIMPPMSPPQVFAEPPTSLPGPSGDEIPETSPANRRLKVYAEPNTSMMSSSIPMPPAHGKFTPNFQSSPPPINKRARRSQTVESTASSLSNLGTTPVVSPISVASQKSTAARRLANASLAGDDSSPLPTKPRKRGPAGRLAKLKTNSTEKLKVPERSSRRFSNSTDELARSETTTPTFEQSLRLPRGSLAKTARAGSKGPQSHRGPKIFEGMAFAISFQSKKPGERTDHYNNRVEFSATLEKRIRQAGGKILDSGFDELFDVPALKTATRSPTPGSPEQELDMMLNQDGRSMGFTALIADGHSRKVKYMQALALGLPCLHYRWVTKCLDAGETVDWSDYLLSAGQSAMLGDAIRSRNLPTYNAATARLADVMAQRSKFLDGSKILLVVKKSLEDEKNAYVFLARVLGATATRVFSMDEARLQAKAAEDAGRPFDWVYVDGKEDAGGLFGTAAAAGANNGRKRKRRSTSASASVLGEASPVLKKIRTLSDELVIQSLIFGRLIEEGEMEE
ncbi:DNA repair protein crb2 [Podospora conica]|nr:DNA repair protein crb2 [Schizothecium conicum]